MKAKSILLLAAMAAPLTAQDPAPPLPGQTRTVTETVTPGQRTVEETVVEHGTPPPPVVPPAPPTPPADFDPGRRLAILPRAVPVPDQPAHGTRTETTETTTTQIGGRVYNTERNVVVVEGRELPYVTIPVLFVRETAELLDAQSRAALDRTAAAIQDVLHSNPDATFDIEGHTSTDGAEDFNMTLSQQRAQRIYEELTQRYQVPPRVLTAHGYGEMYPKYPDGNEAQLTLDRRVLVVRTR